MDLEFFKKEVDRIKKEHEDIYEQVIKNLLELIENLKPAIEYVKTAFNLSDAAKEIECIVPCTYSAAIRWYEKLDDAVFLYQGHDTTLAFSVNDLIDKRIKINKESLQWIGDAFCSKNSVSFAENLLKKLDSDKLYITLY